MQFTVNVQLDNPGESYTKTAAEVLTALGGNPTKDYCGLFIAEAPQPPQHAGKPPHGQGPPAA